MGNEQKLYYRKPQAKKRKRSALPKFLLIFLLIGVASFCAYYFFLKDHFTTKKTVSQEVVVQQNLPTETPKKGELKTLSGEEFRNLYNSFAYPNTEYISEDAVITGDAKTDEHIIELAEKRGYVRRSAPVQDVFREVEPTMKLQERASQPWIDMQKAAKADGINISLSAAYRSAEDQRDLFLDRLSEAGVPLKGISSGAYDSQVDKVLSMTAIPGYSRHHTGYTIDIACDDQPTTTFDYTICFDWLSKDNYKNTKRFGWIPSYPEKVTKQGPEPESWEYVWVGLDSVTN